MASGWRGGRLYAGLARTLLVIRNQEQEEELESGQCGLYLRGEQVGVGLQVQAELLAQRRELDSAPGPLELVRLQNLYHLHSTAQSSLVQSTAVPHTASAPSHRSSAANPASNIHSPDLSDYTVYTRKLCWTKLARSRSFIRSEESHEYCHMLPVSPPLS